MLGADKNTRKVISVETQLQPRSSAGHRRQQTPCDGEALVSPRFQVHRLHQGESGYKLFARTDGATEILLEELTVGDKLKVRGVNDTNEGPFSPEVTVS